MEFAMCKGMIGLVAAVCLAGAAHGQVFDFSSLSHGEIVTNQFSPALTVVGTNPNRSFDLVAAFDTTMLNTADPDLQGPPWSGGNLAVSNTAVSIGNALILAQDDTDANNDNILDNPNDEGSRPAGTIDLTFGSSVPVFGLDIVDIEGVVQEGSSLDFYENNVLVGSVDFGDFTDSNSAFYDATVVFGNNTANRIQPIAASAFGAGGFDRVVINVGGSSAYDTFVVPAPASAMLLAIGGIGAMRRRR